jgi:chromate reductase
MTLLPLDGIPLYNQDLDGPGLPDAVRAFKAAVDSSDGVVMCSPEYNFGMPGVLKNAIDWASRPAFASPLKGKPVLVMTSSPAFTGGVRAQAQLRETLGGTLSRVIARPQVVIAGVNGKIEGGRLADAASLGFALEAVNDLIAEIGLLRAAPTPATAPAQG